jgi:hypothetical protein
MEESSVEKQSNAESFLLGIILGMFIMLGIISVQYYSGLLKGEELSKRLNNVESLLSKIDSRLRID